MGNSRQDEKQVGIRLKDPVLEVLDRRVEELNNLAPESQVTHGTLVKYAVEEYAKKLDRKDVEVTLTFPYEHRALEPIYNIKEHPYVKMEDITRDFSTEDKGKLLEAFKVIIEILENNEDIDSNVVKEWIKVKENLNFWYDYESKGKKAAAESNFLDEIAEEQEVTFYDATKVCVEKEK